MRSSAHTSPCYCLSWASTCLRVRDRPAGSGSPARASCTQLQCRSRCSSGLRHPGCAHPGLLCPPSHAVCHPVLPRTTSCHIMPCQPRGAGTGAEAATHVVQDGDADEQVVPTAASKKEASFTKVAKEPKYRMGKKKVSRWSAEGGVAAGAVDATDAVALTRKVLVLLGRIGGDNRCVVVVVVVRCDRRSLSSQCRMGVCACACWVLGVGVGMGRGSGVTVLAAPSVDHIHMQVRGG